MSTDESASSEATDHLDDAFNEKGDQDPYETCLIVRGLLVSVANVETLSRSVKKQKAGGCAPALQAHRGGSPGGGSGLSPGSTFGVCTPAAPGNAPGRVWVWTSRLEIPSAVVVSGR
jgi:hypothetical protein